MPNVVRLVLTSPETVSSALATTAFEFIDLLRAVPDTAANDPVPGLKWTVAEVAAHVLTVLRRGADMRRSETLEGVADLNDICLAEVQERDMQRLAEQFQADLMEAASRDADPDEPFPLHVGVVADRPTATSYFLGDMLVHGFDIARAAGVPWTVHPDRAAACLRAVLPAMTPWVRPEVLAGARRDLVLGFGDDGVPVHVRVGEGTYQVSAGSPAGVERTDADGASVLLEWCRQIPSGDAIVDRFAGWYLPI